jgi:5-methylthioadenosine/S-adenosylhomocysteine deaminase
LSAHNGYEPFVGDVGIEGGRIARVSGGKLPGRYAREIDASGKILMPGLVNGHCHGDMTLMRGAGDGMTLLEQQREFDGHEWFRGYLSDEDRMHSRMLTYCEALLSGTTFILENMYWGLGDGSQRAMAQIGIRGALAEDIRTDFLDSDNLLSDDQLECFRRRCDEFGIIPVIASVAEEDFEPARLRSIAEKTRRSGMLKTCHLAETEWRLDTVREKFGTTPVRMLADHGLLENMICSHAVHVDDDEIPLLAAAGARVVNTPSCEMKIADGIAPIPKFRAAGVPVGLGTDGALWNNSNDLFGEMKCMVLLHTINSGIRTFGPKDALDMATIDGARAFGMERDIGTIEEGKLADMILIDATPPHMTPLRTGALENVASCVVFCATGADVTDVFVGGRHVVQSRAVTTADVPALCRRVNEISRTVAEKSSRPRGVI